MKKSDRQIYHLLKTVYAHFEMDQIYNAKGRSQKWCALQERIRVALGADPLLPDIAFPRPPLIPEDVDVFAHYWAAQLQEVYLQVLYNASPLKTLKQGNTKSIMTAAAITGLLFISAHERRSDRFAELVKGLVDHPRVPKSRWKYQPPPDS